ncbi:MAG: TraB/GumN family protein, partial [Burkholderiaceae bacterium]
ASTLALREAEAAGYSTQAAVESQLLAQARGRPVDELEGVELQFRLFDAATPAVQQAFLVETLDSVASGAARREVSEIARAWAHGDEAAVRAVLAEMQADPAPGARFMAEQLIAGRHAAMLERIEYFTQQGGLPLVAVGSLHLFGAQGLIEALQRRGWRVTRV